MRNARLIFPSYHTRPTVRMKNPISLSKPDNHPTSSLRNYRFKSLTPREIRMCHELVYDPCTNNRSCPHINLPNQPRFSGNFECGNLGQVYKIGPRSYEILMLPDPTNYYSALWFFFKAENLKPGEYFFVINGFFRDCHQHNIGVQPTAYSERLASKKGIGWMRIGTNLNFWTFKHSLVPEYALSFNFTVTHTDNMYFSLLYPYTFTDLRNFLSYSTSLIKPNDVFSFKASILCKSPGGIDVPAILWDADEQKCVDVSNILSNLPQLNMPNRKRTISSINSSSSPKPLIVIAARLHPGESNSSFAMEGFMDFLNSRSKEAISLLKSFSILMLPMINPDGVICGYYRPSLSGEDVNRVWKCPDEKTQTVSRTVIQLLDRLTRTRNLMFLLDFHGHTAQSNCFTYGVQNPSVWMNDKERQFPRTMAKVCHLFDEKESISWKPSEFPQTMRVALHTRYKIPFSYTLEMSFGAIEIGPEKSTQMTPHHYRYIGQMTGVAINEMFQSINSPSGRHSKASLPPLSRTDNE